MIWTPPIDAPVGVPPWRVPPEFRTREWERRRSGLYSPGYVPRPLPRLAAFGLIATDSGNGNDTFSTPGMDSSGANFFAIAYAGVTACAPSDSRTFTWTQAVVNSGFRYVEIWFAYNVTGGSSHTFTFTGTDQFASAAVFAFSGGDTANPLDQSNSNQAFGWTTLTTGSVTPTTNDQLVFAASQGDATGVPTINGGFSTVVGNAGSGGVYLGGGGAYLIQTTATAANPTWTYSSAVNGANCIATFKAGAGGGATNWGPLLGMQNNRLVRA